MEGEATTWEIARLVGTAARLPVASCSTGDEMATAIAEVLKSGSAVSVWRTDQTPEAKRAQWESDFYDLDRAGRRRRRFKRPLIEREWEAWAKSERAVARVDKKDDKDGNYACDRCTKTWSKRAPDGFDHRCDNPV